MVLMHTCAPGSMKLLLSRCTAYSSVNLRLSSLGV